MVTVVAGVSVALLRRRTAEDYCQEALRLSRAKDYAGALAAADKAIKAGPEHALAYHLRGSALSELGRNDDALDALRQALTLDPSLSYVQYKIALVLSFLGRQEEALAATDAAIGLDPNDYAAYVLRGATLFELERYDEALDALAAALDRRPGLGQVHVNRAQILRLIGRYPEALAEYDRALELVPGLPGVPEQKGITRALAGHYHDALAEFGTAPTGTAAAWAGAINWHLGHPAQSRALFKQAAGQPLGTNRAESASLQAIVTCALGQPDAAADLLRQAEPVHPALRDVTSLLYDLVTDPPMPGADQLRALALGS
jgi:Tfp pilus assembly protein PilF